MIRRGIAPVIGRARMAWRRRDVRTHQRQIRRADVRAARTARWAEVRTWRDEAVQAVLHMLAKRWPDRWQQRYEQQRDENAMFRQLAAIHDQAARTGSRSRPTGHDDCADDGEVGQ